MQWLLESDPAIQYQTRRDLLEDDNPKIRKRIEKLGWGSQILSKRRADGHWGNGFSQPKWISSHYTLLDLKNLSINPELAAARECIRMILETEKGRDGGLNPSRDLRFSDVCINGMFLNYASYFGADQNELKSIIDFILSQKMNDGGFNCEVKETGARHSSMHSTISVLEGILEYKRMWYSYRLSELEEAAFDGHEFLLRHQLFLSDQPDDPIRKEFMNFAYPCRWKYDILRALDYFQDAGQLWDVRLRPALDALLTKRNRDGTWNTPAPYPGLVHFEMEYADMPGRWNTLRALRVQKYFSEKKSSERKRI